MKHGYANQSRDLSTTIPCRVDFGCAGLDNTILNGLSAPAHLCGISIFDQVGSQEKIILKNSLANILDAVQNRDDECFETHNQNVPFLNHKQDAEYSSHIRNFIGCNVFHSKHVKLIVNFMGVAGNKGKVK